MKEHWRVSFLCLKWKNLDKRPNFIVGIGGSAGGLSAYKAILNSLPGDTGMAFVIIAHLSPNHESLLTGILAHKTPMPVIEAADAMIIEANHVYVIPPNTDLLIKNGAFKVVSPRTMRGGRHKQVDNFLESLSDAMGEHAISVILSGYDGDGTEGSLRSKAKGGKTFAQDMSALVDSMPLHAQASGCVDFVLPPEKIAEHLTAISGAAA